MIELTTEQAANLLKIALKPEPDMMRGIHPLFAGILRQHFAPRPNAGNCATCGEHWDALRDGLCWNCHPRNREHREIAPMWTGKELQ